ncbi:hypothetical protein [Lentibacillus juripiscarius]|uniref:Uncharacterized protein n=1 Tax=Lentibacillus juripiscarius TaxID=257446 RepID=A0ABW5V498_9BACI
MTEIRLPRGMSEGTDKQHFADAITGMADQLRLMEQKIAMAADNSVRDQFRTNKDELSRAQFRIEKLVKTHVQTQDANYPSPSDNADFTEEVKQSS